MGQTPTTGPFRRASQRPRQSVSLLSGTVKFASENQLVVDPTDFRRIEISITREKVVSSFFVNNPKTGVNYAVPLLYSPGSGVKRIAFLEMSFVSQQVNFSNFFYSDNLGAIGSASGIEADVVMVGYPRQ